MKNRISGLTAFTAHALVACAVGLGYIHGFSPYEPVAANVVRQMASAERLEVPSDDDAENQERKTEADKASDEAAQAKAMTEKMREISTGLMPPLPPGMMWTFDKGGLTPDGVRANGLSFAARELRPDEKFVPLSDSLREHIADDLWMTRLYEYKDQSFTERYAGDVPAELVYNLDPRTGLSPGIAIGDHPTSVGGKVIDWSKDHVVEMGASMVKFNAVEAALHFWEAYTTNDPFVWSEFIKHIQTVDGAVGFWAFSAGSQVAGSMKWVRATGPFSHFVTLGAGMWFQTFMGRLTPAWKELRHAWRVSPDVACTQPDPKQPANDCREKTRLANAAHQQLFNEIFSVKGLLDMIPDTIAMAGATFAAQGTVTLGKQIIEKGYNAARGNYDYKKSLELLRGAEKTEEGVRKKGKWILKLIEKDGRKLLKIPTAAESAQEVEVAMKSIKFLIRGGRLIAKPTIVLAILDGLIDIGIMLKWNEKLIPPVKTFWKSTEAMQGIESAKERYEEALSGYFKLHGLTTPFTRTYADYSKGQMVIPPSMPVGGPVPMSAPYAHHVAVRQYKSEEEALKDVAATAQVLQKAWDEYRAAFMSPAESLYGSRIAELNQVDSDIASMKIGYVWANDGGFAKNNVKYQLDADRWTEAYDGSWFGKDWGKIKANVLEAMFCGPTLDKGGIVTQEHFIGIPMGWAGAHTLRIKPMRVASVPGLCYGDIAPYQEVDAPYVVNIWDTYPKLAWKKVPFHRLPQFMLEQCERDPAGRLCSRNLPKPENSVFIVKGLGEAVEDAISGLRQLAQEAIAKNNPLNMNRFAFRKQWLKTNVGYFEGFGSMDRDAIVRAEEQIEDALGRIKDANQLAQVMANADAHFPFLKTIKEIAETPKYTDEFMELTFDYGGKKRAVTLGSTAGIGGSAWGQQLNDPTWKAMAWSEYRQTVHILYEKDYNARDDKNAEIPVLINSINERIKPTQEELVTNYNVAVRNAMIKGITGTDPNGHWDPKINRFVNKNSIDRESWRAFLDFVTGKKKGTGKSGDFASLSDKTKKTWIFKYPRGQWAAYIDEWEMWTKYGEQMAQIMGDKADTMKGVQSSFNEIQQSLTGKIRLNAEISHYFLQKEMPPQLPENILKEGDEALLQWKSLIMADNYREKMLTVSEEAAKRQQQQCADAACMQPLFGGGGPMLTESQILDLRMQRMQYEAKKWEERMDKIYFNMTPLRLDSLAPAGPDLVHGMDTPAEAQKVDEKTIEKANSD